MVGPYPAAAGLRRRVARLEAQGQLFPDDVRTDAAEPQAPAVRRRRRQSPPARREQASHPTRMSNLYFIFSTLLALLAIVTRSSRVVDPKDSPNPIEPTVSPEPVSVPILPSKIEDDSESLPDLFQRLQDIVFPTEKQGELQNTNVPASQPKKRPPPWLRWLLKFDAHDDLGDGRSFNKANPKSVFDPQSNPFVSFLLSLVDPSLLRPTPTTPTDIIDKILTSTPRILSMTNFFLSMTFLLHKIVADWFLGVHRNSAAGPDHDQRWAGRERLGGFLVFKLLLISAVVAPDTLDLLILLSWYTLLSFLRSLAHLCAASTAHTSQSGLPPSKGVLRLLTVVLFSDSLAAAVCVALFHGAGWGMVVLLTCDCVLLAVDVVSHMMRHAAQAMEEGHARSVQELEERQLVLHRNQEQGSTSPRRDVDSEDTDGEHRNRDAMEESRRLDRRMEVLETAHARRLQILDTTVFSLQLLTYMLTVAHFLHIWSLHGLQFTLIDGVLALHLHSALVSFGKKIAERRNLNRIARDLDGLFDDASELDLRKAAAAGDVCCICLVTMGSAANVKKVGCGHLYHTHCLREVVERARSIEAARCPLCRASVVDGTHAVPVAPVANPNNNGTVPPILRNNVAVMGEPIAFEDGIALQQPRQLDPPPVNNNQGEHALFRFSTEHILPAWLPLPAFSFEVVRRPPVGTEPPPVLVANDTNVRAMPQQAPPDGADRNVNVRPQSPQPSFLRRLLILAGAIPMSPEEEARALEQLVDMFPQYDRADLLRELRERGSAEAVVEAVLMGIFSGVPRGGAVADAQPQGIAARNDPDDGSDAAQ